MKLLPSQVNEIYKIIKDFGFDRDQFVFKNVGNTTLEFVRSEFYFKFLEGLKGGRIATYSPGRDKYIESVYPESWGHQLLYVKSWLINLQRELDAIDLLKTLMEEVKSVESGKIDFNENKFSIKEIEDLSASIADLKLKVSKFDILEAQIKTINRKLDDLLVFAKDMKKTDWKSLFIGTIISWVADRFITIQIGRELFTIFENSPIKKFLLER